MYQKKVKRGRPKKIKTPYVELAIFAFFVVLFIFNTFQVISTDKKQIQIVDTVHAQTIVTNTPEPSKKVEFTIPPTLSVKVKTIQDKICEKFGSKCLDALLIAYNESHYQNIRSHKPNKNNTYDWGVFQINEIHCKKLNLGGNCTKLLDEDTNIQMALLISGNGTSWKAWSTCSLLPKCY